MVSRQAHNLEIAGSSPASATLELLHHIVIFISMTKKQKKYHYIYKTTNLINKKYYIGMHSTSNMDDGYIGSGKKLWFSIKKYGKENFKCEILEILPDRKSLKKRERELVNEDLLKDKTCLNLRLGGEGGGGFFSKEHRYNFFAAGGKKVRQMFSKIHFDRLKTDEEYREKWRENVRKSGVWSGKIWQGRKHKEETKKKIGEINSKKQKGKNNSQFGTRWITNGIENKKIKTQDLIPDGWRLGRNLNSKKKF